MTRQESGRGSGEDGFSAFVAANRLMLVRTAAGMIGRPGPDAEDLVQNAFVKLAPRWGDVEQPLAYARQILARLVVDAARGRTRRPERIGLARADLDLLDTAAPDPGEQFGNADELWQAMAALSLRQRQVLSLRYLCDCDEAETARILDCPLGTVKSEAHRGLKKLRRNLVPPTESSSSERGARHA